MIPEPNKSIKVAYECDVVVVGGGPGGIGAAVSAARNGANTVLIERYRSPGRYGYRRIGNDYPLSVGFRWEHADRRHQPGMDRADWTSVKPAATRVRKSGALMTPICWITGMTVLFSPSVKTELSTRPSSTPKFPNVILNDMVNEARIKTYLHAWGTMPLMEGNKAVGVVFESKSGRQAVMAKIVIDSTGDGDLLPFTPATFDTDIDPNIRIANLSLCYWIDNVNLQKCEDFRREQYRRLASDDG